MTSYKAVLTTSEISPKRIAGLLILLFAAGCCVGQESKSAADDEQGTVRQSQQNTEQKDTSELHKLEVLPAEWLIGPYIPPKGPFRPLTLGERRDAYFRQTYLNAGAYAARLFTAGIDQARGVPSQWGGGAAGYGQRFGSRYGQFVISNTLQAVGNAALGYEPRYDLCSCKGLWPRTKHAIARNFVTYNNTERERRPQFALYAGAMGAGVISSVWLPGHRNPWKEGGYSVLSQAGYGSAINWASEFALDILHKIDRKRYPLPGK